MRYLLKNGNIYTRNGFMKNDIFVIDNSIFLSTNVTSYDNLDEVFDCSDAYIIPGFVDVHVHLREPGFFYKETIKTGTLAGAHGGYTCICSMPNLNPAPSTLNGLKEQLNIIEQDAVIKVIPYGTITISQSGQGQLSHMEKMAPYVIGFSDDGKGVQDRDLMKTAMLKAKGLGKPIVAHCEDESLLDNGYIHKGDYAKLHGHRGISSESEWKQVERDIALCKETGVTYHVCHISTKETVELIRRAKKDGVKITCETAPHYLIFCDEDLKEDGKWKMNPPLRSRQDRKALIEGIKDGTIDVIATDHAPHSREEKSKGLENSAFGIVGLETAFPVLYTKLVKKGVISLEKLIELMAINPRKIFNLEGGYIEDNQVADFTIIDPNKKYKIDSNDFLSKGNATPFDGMEVEGQVITTFVNGNIAWEK